VRPNLRYGAAVGTPVPAGPAGALPGRWPPRAPGGRGLPAAPRFAGGDRPAV